MGLLADADATLIHKDFAKSKQWSFVALCAALSPVLTVLAVCGGSDMQLAVMATAGSMLATHGVITGLNTKKLNKLLKEMKE